MPKLNINPERKVAKDFSPTPFTRRLGPKPAAGETSPVSEVQQNANQEVEYNDWQVMDNFDEGLRQALISWIDTTKEGKVLTNATGSTRSKTINFQFYGNPSKDVVGAGDIGEFSLQFKYTKRIVQPQATGGDTLLR